MISGHGTEKLFSMGFEILGLEKSNLLRYRPRLNCHTLGCCAYKSLFQFFFGSSLLISLIDFLFLSPVMIRLYLGPFICILNIPQQLFVIYLPSEFHGMACTNKIDSTEQNSAPVSRYN